MSNNYHWYDEYRPKLSKRLHEQLLTRSEEEPLAVIIILREDVKPEDDEVRRHVRSLGGEIRRELRVIRAFATELPGRALAEIGPHAVVRRVHLDRNLHPCLDIAIPSIFADKVQAEGHTGRGVTIAVLDSGIHPHADFMKPAPRLLAWCDLVGKHPLPYDDHGHGTHVAGIAAGNGYASNGRYRGVATSADIVAVKVADAEGSAPMSRVIEGLQWVLDHRVEHRIRVINLSLGSDPSESYREDPLCQAVEEVWREGVVVVVAAGNDGPAPGSIDTPGNDPLVITVGAMDDLNTIPRRDDIVPGFSSRGPTNDGLGKPDLLAPGVGIVAPQTGGGYTRRTGTSMAAPFVSGAAALLLADNPDLRPDRVKQKLRAAAEDRHLSEMTEGAGYLDLQKLFQSPTAGRGKHAPAGRTPGAGKQKPPLYD